MVNGLDVKVISIFKYGKPDSQIRYQYESIYEGIQYINLYCHQERLLVG